MNLKELSELITNHEQKNIPVHCRAPKRLNDNSANDLTTSIIAYFKYMREVANVKMFAERQGVEGRYRQGQQVTDVIGRTRLMKGMYLPANNGGAADIKAMIRGRAIEIEVKYGKDVQSELQKKYQKKIEAGGGIYIIVKTWDDFIMQIDNYL